MFHRSDVFEFLGELQQLKDRQAQLASLTDDKNKLTERIASIDATLGNYDERAAQLAGDLKEATEARVAAVEAKNTAMNEREAALQAKRDAEERLARANEQIADLRRSVEQTTQEVARKETLIEAYAAYTGLTAQEVHGNVPTINASVVGVMEQGGMTLVHLNVGKDQEVKRGYEFAVYNGASLKGRARVEVVNNATSTAVLIDAPEGRKPATGDRASTRL